VIYNGNGLQVFYNENREPIEVPPHFIVDIQPSPPSIPNVHRIDKITPYLKPNLTYVIVRSYALGDILMLIPVMREFKDKYSGSKVVLVTSGRFMTSIILRELSGDVFNAISYRIYTNPKHYDVGIILNDILERDHQDPKYSVKHRVDIYREFLGLKSGELPVWNEEEISPGKHGVVFCSAGNTRKKALEDETASYIEKKLVSRFNKVCHINHNQHIPEQELLDKIRQARAVITMDTAPLWIAHFYRTPVVFLSGPTRGKERLCYHPLFPDGVSEVSMSEMVGCTPCFEKADTCHMNIDCMRVPKAKVWEAVNSALEKVMWKS